MLGARGVLGIGNEWYEHYNGGDSSIFMTAARQFSSKASPGGKILLNGYFEQHYKHELGVQVVFRNTEEFKSMHPLGRKCYYPREKDLQIFPEYNQVSCELECIWKDSLGKCGCMPWFLREHFPSAKMCNWHGNRCFKQNVEDYSSGVLPPQCSTECLDDCEKHAIEIRSIEAYGGSYKVLPGEFERKCLAGGYLEEYQTLACNHFQSRLNNTHPVVMKMIPKNLKLM